MKDFFSKYKVFLFGLLMAIATTGIELYNNGVHASPWVIGWGLFIAGLSYIGRNIRGQWASIIGIVLSTVMAFYNLHATPDGVTWNTFFKDLVMPLLSALVTVLWTTPAKSRGYESSEVISQAKQEGDNRIPTLAKAE